MNDFTPDPTTIRFISVYRKLETDNRFRTQKEFAEKLGLHPQSLSQILKHKRDITLGALHHLFKHYNVDPIAVFGDLPENANIYGNAVPIDAFTEEGNLQNAVAKQTTNPLKPNFRPVAVTVDNKGNDNIVMVQSKAAAGYAGNIATPEFIGNLPTFSLPGEQFRNATFRCFEVAGASMEDTIYSGDWVIASLVNDWEVGIRDGHIYVVVTEDSILVKRILNRFNKFGQFVLKSDNPAGYSNIYLEPSEIREIWYVKAKLSFNFPNRNLDLIKNINDLQIDLERLENRVKNLESETQN